MPNFRTSSLFHYTNYSALKKILRDGLMPNYCREELPFKNKENPKESIWGIPMVSFCDIPLMRTHIFNNRYGRHAIGLSKEWALRNNINPIIYVVNDGISLSLRFLVSYEKHLKKELKKYGSNGDRIVINPKDKDAGTKLSSFVYHGETHRANVHLLGFSKKYEGSDRSNKKHCNYEENEWRYIVRENDDVVWKRGEAEYNEWRGDLSNPKPHSTELEKNKLKFNAADINHIVVEKEEQLPFIVEYIDSLQYIGGTDEKLKDKEKKLLYSKIISMEKIRKDF